jgi:hypothetical protein
MSNFYSLQDDTIQQFNSVFKKKAFPVDMRFQFVGNSKQKQLIKISKIADSYAFILDKELLVSINEDIMAVFDDESVGILIEQEIDKVSINIDTGKIKMVKPDLTTFSSLINKYGIDKIAKANNLEELYSQQKEDQQVELI